jgi:hypothetical protein
MERGADIFRSKGVLSIAGTDDKCACALHNRMSLERCHINNFAIVHKVFQATKLSHWMGCDNHPVTLGCKWDLTAAGWFSRPSTCS